MPRKVSKFIALVLCFLLCFEQSGFAQVAVQLDISGHLSALRNSLFTEKFRPLHLRYLSYSPQANTFQLLLDKGSAKPNELNELNEQTKQLLKYFLIGITLPNDSFWVNLRPDSPDNIIDEKLAQTDIGKIFLEIDLQLKKDTAKATSPETPEGKEYWNKLYQKAEELFGYENVTIPTLTRPWIVPDEIIIRTTPTNAYIYKATLKVLLEEDCLKSTEYRVQSTEYTFTDPRLKELNQYSSQLIRELIIPKLTKEVNNAKRYAPLRQVYYSLILSHWFKQNSLGQNNPYARLIDRQVLTGLTSTEPIDSYTYFQQYKDSFAKGEYNIQEPRYTPFGQTIRSYFSGGINLHGGNHGIVAATENVTPGPGQPSMPHINNAAIIPASIPVTPDGELGEAVTGESTTEPVEPPAVPLPIAQQQDEQSAAPQQVPQKEKAKPVKHAGWQVPFVTLALSAFLSLLPGSNQAEEARLPQHEPAAAAGQEQPAEEKAEPNLDQEIAAQVEKILLDARLPDIEKVRKIQELDNNYMAYLNAALGNSNPNVRCWAIYVLGWVGQLNRDLRSTIFATITQQQGKAINDPNAEVRYAAIYLLVRVARSLPALAKNIFTIFTQDRKGFSDPDERVRSAAIEACGWLIELLPEFGEKIVAALTQDGKAINDPELGVRYVTARTLGEIAESSPALTDKIIAALTKAINDPDHNVRHAAFSGLSKVGAAAVPVLRKILNTTVSDEMRYDVILALGSAGGQEALDLLIQIAKSQNITNDQTQREAVFAALAKVGAPAVPFLIGLLGDAHGNVRFEAIQALAAIEDEGKFPGLIDLFRKRAPLASKSAGRVLAASGAAAVPALLELLGDKEDIRIREASLEILKEMAGREDGPKEAKFYFNLYNGRLDDIVAEAAANREKLIAALDSGCYKISASAAKALAMIGKGAAELLREAAQSGNKDTLVRAVELLERMSDKEEVRKAFSVLLPLAGHAEAEVRAALAETLGSTADKEAIPAILQLFRDRESNFVREAAAHALMKIPDPRAIPSLIEALDIAPADENDIFPNFVQGALSRIGEDALPALKEVINNPHKSKRSREAAAAVLEHIEQNINFKKEKQERAEPAVSAPELPRGPALGRISRWAGLAVLAGGFANGLFAGATELAQRQGFWEQIVNALQNPLALIGVGTIFVYTYSAAIAMLIKGYNQRQELAQAYALAQRLSRTEGQKRVSPEEARFLVRAICTERDPAKREFIARNLDDALSFMVNNSQIDFNRRQSAALMGALEEASGTPARRYIAGILNYILAVNPGIKLTPHQRKILIEIIDKDEGVVAGVLANALVNDPQAELTSQDAGVLIAAIKRLGLFADGRYSAALGNAIANTPSLAGVAIDAIEDLLNDPQAEEEAIRNLVFALEVALSRNASGVQFTQEQAGVLVTALEKTHSNAFIELTILLKTILPAQPSLVPFVLRRAVRSGKAGDLLDIVSYAIPSVNLVMDEATLLELTRITDPHRRKFCLSMIIEPLSFRMPELFTEKVIEALAKTYSKDPEFKYLLFNLQDRRAHDPALFPHQEKFRQAMSGKGKRVLIWHNITDGLGDEVIREGVLIQALFDFNPELEEVVIYTTPRTRSIYSRDKVKVKNIGKYDLTDSDNFDMVVHFSREKLLGDDDKESEAKFNQFLEAHPPRVYIRARNNFHNIHEIRVDGAEVTPVPYAIDRTDMWRGNVYVPVLRACAELGLSFRRGSQSPGTPSIFTGTHHQQAQIYWDSLIEAKARNEDDSRRPVVVLSVFGGASKDKGLDLESPEDSASFVTMLRRLIAAGCTPLIIPGPNGWGTRAQVSRALAYLSANEQKYVEAAPELKDDPLLYKYLYAFAQSLIAVEGNAVHLGFHVGAERLVAFTAPGSGEMRVWFPRAAGRTQGVARDAREATNAMVGMLKSAGLLPGQTTPLSGLRLLWQKLGRQISALLLAVAAAINPIRAEAPPQQQPAAAGQKEPGEQAQALDADIAAKVAKILKGGGSIAEKTKEIQELNKDAVLYLINALAGQDADVGSSAAWVLGKIVKSTPALGEQILNALTQPDKGVNHQDAGVRASAAEALEEIVKSTPALGEKLLNALTQPDKGINHQDADVRSSAAVALDVVVISAPALGEKIFDALTQPDKGVNHQDAGVRSSAAWVLGSMVSLTPALGERILNDITQPDKGINDQDADVRSSAARALGAVASFTPALGEKLLNALTQPDKGINHQDAGVRSSAAWVLGDLEESLPEGDVILRAKIAGLFTVLDALKSLQEKYPELELFKPGASPAAGLMEKFKAGDEQVRQYAALALGHFGAIEAIPLLVEALIADDGVAAGSIAVALRGLEEKLRAENSAEEANAKSAAPLLIKELKVNHKGSGRVTRNLIHALAEIGQPVYPYLISLLNDKEDRKTCEAVAEALSKTDYSPSRVYGLLYLGQIDELIADRALHVYVAEGINSPSYEVSSSAAEVLKKIGTSETVDVLLSILQDSKSNAARRWAIEVLGVIGGKKSIPALKEVLKDKDTEIVAAAAAALFRLGAPEALEALLAPLSETLRTSLDSLERASAAAKLSKLGQPAIEHLKQAIADPDPFVRAVCAKGLANLNAQEAKGAIEKLLNDPDPEVQEAAREALEKLKSQKESREKQSGEPQGEAVDTSQFIPQIRSLISGAIEIGFEGGIGEVNQEAFASVWEKAIPVEISEEHRQVLEDPAMGPDFRAPGVRLTTTQDEIDSLAGTKGEHHVLRSGNQVLIEANYWQSRTEPEKLDILMHESMADWHQRMRPEGAAEDIAIDLEGLKVDEAQRRAKHKGLGVDGSMQGEVVKPAGQLKEYNLGKKFVVGTKGKFSDTDKLEKIFTGDVLIKAGDCVYRLRVVGDGAETKVEIQRLSSAEGSALGSARLFELGGEMVTVGKNEKKNKYWVSDDSKLSPLHFEFRVTEEAGQYKLEIRDRQSWRGTVVILNEPATGAAQPRQGQEGDVAAAARQPQVAPTEQQKDAEKVWAKAELKDVAPLTGVEERVVAISDIHADLEALREILEGAGLIIRGQDADGLDDRWTGGNTRVVQGGDVLDRGKQSIEVLKYLDYLQQQAAASDGKLIRLLGNHELNYLLRQALGKRRGSEKTNGADPGIWNDPDKYEAVRKSIAEGIKNGSVVAAYALGGKVFSHGVVMPALIEKLKQKYPQADNPEGYAAAVNAILKEAVEKNNFGHFIFGPVEGLEGVSDITRYYFSNLEPAVIDQMPFDLVVFHDPLPFMGEGRIAVKKGLMRPSRTVVAADVGMWEGYGSGRAALVFEEGEIRMVSSSAEVLERAKLPSGAFLTPEAKRLALAIVLELQGSHTEAVEVLQDKDATAALNPQVAQQYLDAYNEYAAAQSQDEARGTPFFLARTALRQALSQKELQERYFGKGHSAMNQLKYLNFLDQLLRLTEQEAALAEGAPAALPAPQAVAIEKAAPEPESGLTDDECRLIAAIVKAADGQKDEAVKLLQSDRVPEIDAPTLRRYLKLRSPYDKAREELKEAQDAATKKDLTKKVNTTAFITARQFLRGKLQANGPKIASRYFNGNGGPEANEQAAINSLKLSERAYVAFGKILHAPSSQPADARTTAIMVGLSPRQQKIIAQVMRGVEVIPDPHALSAIHWSKGGAVLTEEEVQEFLQMKDAELEAQWPAIEQSARKCGKIVRYKTAWEGLLDLRDPRGAQQRFQERTAGVIDLGWKKFFSVATGGLGRLRGFSFDQLAREISAIIVPDDVYKEIVGPAGHALVYISEDTVKAFDNPGKKGNNNDYGTPEDIEHWLLTSASLVAFIVKKGAGVYIFPLQIARARNQGSDIGKTSLFHEYLEKLCAENGLVDDPVVFHNNMVIIEQELIFAALLGEEEFNAALAIRKAEQERFIEDSEESIRNYAEQLSVLVGQAVFADYRTRAEELWKKQEDVGPSAPQPAQPGLAVTAEELQVFAAELTEREKKLVAQLVRGKQVVLSINMLSGIPEGEGGGELKRDEVRRFLEMDEHALQKKGAEIITSIPYPSRRSNFEVARKDLFEKRSSYLSRQPSGDEAAVVAQVTEAGAFEGEAGPLLDITEGIRAKVAQLEEPDNGVGLTGTDLEPGCILLSIRGTRRKIIGVNGDDVWVETTTSKGEVYREVLKRETILGGLKKDGAIAAVYRYAQEGDFADAVIAALKSGKLSLPINTDAAGNLAIAPGMVTVNGKQIRIVINNQQGNFAIASEDGKEVSVNISKISTVLRNAGLTGQEKIAAASRILIHDLAEACALQAGQSAALAHTEGEMAEARYFHDLIANWGYDDEQEAAFRKAVGNSLGLSERDRHDRHGRGMEGDVVESGARDDFAKADSGQPAEQEIAALSDDKLDEETRQGFIDSKVDWLVRYAIQHPRQVAVIQKELGRWSMTLLKEFDKKLSVAQDQLATVILPGIKAEKTVQVHFSQTIATLVGGQSDVEAQATNVRELLGALKMSEGLFNDRIINIVVERLVDGQRKCVPLTDLNAALVPGEGVWIMNGPADGSGAPSHGMDANAGQPAQERQGRASLASNQLETDRESPEYREFWKYVDSLTIGDGFYLRIKQSSSVKEVVAILLQELDGTPSSIDIEIICRILGMSRSLNATDSLINLLIGGKFFGEEFTEEQVSICDALGKIVVGITDVIKKGEIVDRVMMGLAGEETASRLIKFFGREGAVSAFINNPFGFAVICSRKEAAQILQEAQSVEQLFTVSVGRLNRDSVGSILLSLIIRIYPEYYDRLLAHLGAKASPDASRVSDKLKGMAQGEYVVVPSLRSLEQILEIVENEYPNEISILYYPDTYAGCRSTPYFFVLAYDRRVVRLVHYDASGEISEITDREGLTEKLTQLGVIGGNGFIAVIKGEFGAVPGLSLPALDIHIHSHPGGVGLSGQDCLFSAQWFHKIDVQEEGGLGAVSQKEKGVVELPPQQNAGQAGLPATPQGENKGGIDGSTGSPSVPQADKNHGGIDLRSLPIVTQPLPLRMPAGAAGLPAINIGKEWLEIERLVDAGIEPSAERIKDYIEENCSQDDFNSQIDRILACFANILRLEEENCSATDSALKELLQLLESGKPKEEFKLSLLTIKSQPQEAAGLDDFTYEDKRNESAKTND